MPIVFTTLTALAALASCGPQAQTGAPIMIRQDDPPSAVSVPAEAKSAVDQAKADAAARTRLDASVWKVIRLEHSGGMRVVLCG